MLCVIFNSAAPAGARPLMATRLGAATQEEKRSPTRDNGKKSKCAKFHRNHSRRCGRRFNAERRESCRIIRQLGSENQIEAALSVSGRASQLCPIVSFS